MAARCTQGIDPEGRWAGRSPSRRPGATGRRHALDDVRIEAATALNEVCRLLDQGHLPQDAIDHATDAAIAGWKRLAKRRY
jgi:hypothetical protein